jgi:hypothetical protein
MNTNRHYLYFGSNPNQNNPYLPSFPSESSGSGYVGPTGTYCYCKRVSGIPGQPPQFYGDLMGYIENQSSVVSTFTINVSKDNGQTDPYASNAQSFYVNGSSVSTVTLQPGGKVGFVILSVLGNITRPYYRFNNTLGAWGKIGLVVWVDLFETRNIEGIP